MVTDFRHVLLELMECNAPSGFEEGIAERIELEFKRFAAKVDRDALGNVIAYLPADETTEKTGLAMEERPKIMIAAHMDEVAMLVTKIEPGGFLRVTQLGGLDPRTLLGQEVCVHGKKTFHGVIGSKPPHLTAEGERDKAVPLEELFIDMAQPEDVVRDHIEIGDLVTVVRRPVELLNGRIAGKSLDNRASLVAVLECLQELTRMRRQADVFVVATVQEETTMAGAFTSSFGLKPDIGIAVDVTHAPMPGVAKDLTAEFHGGPAVALGPNIHPQVFRALMETAKQNRIPYQIKTYQGPTPTDARAIQITASGIATGLLSIPLRYMHTSVEMIEYHDIRATGLLLAHFIAGCDRGFVEGLSCY
jgi:putative aminopeptidase FrvX